MKFLKPIFAIVTVLFFMKEFSLLFSLHLFVDKIPDILFLVIILIYAIFYISPIFKPELIEGYELPSFDHDEEEEEVELTDEEKEIRDLEKISL